MKNLENYGVQTLNAKEIRETSGGSLLGALLAIVGGAILTDMLLNPSATADAWSDGYNSFVDIRDK